MVRVRTRVEQLEDRVCLSTFFESKVVAQTGPSTGYGFTSLGRCLSINNAGFVAFVGESENGDGLLADNIYALDPQDARINQLMSPVFMYPKEGSDGLNRGTQSIFGEVQINNDNQVLARRRLNAEVQVEFPFGDILTAPLTYLETWDASRNWDETSPRGLPVQQVAMGVSGAASTHLWFFLNPATAGVYPSPLDLDSPYEGLYRSSTINNLGQVSFSAILYGAGDNRISSNVIGDLVGRAPLSSTTLPIEPMLADNGWYVFKTGDGRNFAERWDLSGLRLLAGPSLGFTTVSEAGISDDGRVIIFAATNSVTGPGLYASFFDGASTGYPAPVKVLGISGDGMLNQGETHNDVDFNGVVDPGEDQGGLSGFDLATRVPVNRTLAEQPGHYTVAFLATGRGLGPGGLFTLTLDAENRQVGEVATVVEYGGMIPGLSGGVASVSLHDSVNNGGQLAYFATTSTGQAGIIRGVPIRLDIVTDGDDDPATPIGAGDPTTDFVRIGLWDRAYDSTGAVLVDPVNDANNYIGRD